MNIHDLYRPVSRRFRRRRMEQFIERLAPGPETTILDIGGSPWFWADIPVEARITVLNPQVPDAMRRYPGRVEVVEGDGCRLPYGDRSFDIAFSNSAIEHVASWEKQAAFARETARVGRSYWVQTPARCFPVETHWLAPFIHWMPAAVQRRAARWFTLYGWLERPNPEAVRRMVAEIRLLSARELRQLFPDAALLVERFLGLPKSYTVYRVDPARGAGERKETR